MKRLALIFVSALLVLSPMTASALEMMNDASMKDVTGQAGVSIAIDDVVIYQESIADTTYWDTDGVAANGDTAEYGVQISYDDNTRKLITVEAIYDETEDGLGGKYTPTMMGTVDDPITPELEGYGFTDLDGAAVTGIGFDHAAALSIDVGSCRVLSAGQTYNVQKLDPTLPAVTIAGVVIGLPTVEITQYHTNDRKSIGLATYSDANGDNSAADAANAGATFIDIEKSGTSRMAILGGTLEIAPH